MEYSIPPLLRAAVAADAARRPARRRWLDALPGVIDGLAERWGLRLGHPYEPGGRAAWIAPARRSDGRELVLKVGWRHFEAEHEIEALRLWGGDGAVRCLDADRSRDTIALLLERCSPGTQLCRQLGELEQDVVIAGLLRRLWTHPVPVDAPFRALETMTGLWANSLSVALDRGGGDLDTGLVREAVTLLRELPASAKDEALLCTDLHAENVLAAVREPWLVVDPKPFVGDRAYDPVQHMLNCEGRLAGDPVGMARRMAELLDLDADRVRRWLFTRCAQESLHDLSLREPARRLAAG